jgi:hypothetical protein
VFITNRGGFQGAFGAVWALASATGRNLPNLLLSFKILPRLITGPPIGGALAASNYRWLFYLNLPLTGVVFAVVALFMNLKVPAGTIREKLGRMDWCVTRNIIFGYCMLAYSLLVRIGNAIFIPSISYVSL